MSEERRGSDATHEPEGARAIIDLRLWFTAPDRTVLWQRVNDFRALAQEFAPPGVDVKYTQLRARAGARFSPTIEPSRRPRSRRMTPVRSASAIVWCCDVCGDPIENGAGYLCASMTDAFAAMRAIAATEKRDGGLAVVALAEFLADCPDPVPWRVLHRSCDPEPDSDDYWIAIERARTPAQLLERAAHLQGKNWIGYTTWADVLRRAAASLEQRTPGAGVAPRRRAA